MKPPHYLISLLLLLMFSACETTRVNNDKPTARAQICNVSDRCGITP